MRSAHILGFTQRRMVSSFATLWYSLSVPFLTVKDCLVFEDVTDTPSRNVGNYPSALRKTQNVRRSYLHSFGNLFKSHIF